MSDRAPRQSVSSAGFLEGLSWRQELKTELAAELREELRAFRALVLAVSPGYATIQRLTDNGTLANQNEVAQHVFGPDVTAGDYVLCVSVNGVAVVIGTIPMTAPSVYGFAIPVAAVPALPPNQLTQDVADTTSTTNTATFVQAAALTIVTPAIGTWSCRAVGLIRLSNSLPTAANLRFAAGAFTSAARIIAMTTTLALVTTTTALGPFAASTSVTFALQYKSSGASTTSADQASIVLDPYRAT